MIRYQIFCKKENELPIIVALMNRRIPFEWSSEIFVATLPGDKGILAERFERLLIEHHAHAEPIKR